MHLQSWIYGSVYTIWTWKCDETQSTNFLVLVWIANCMQYIESTFRPNLRPSNSDSFTLSSFDHRLVALVVGATSQWWMDRMGGFEENTLEFEEVTLADCTCTWCWSYILSRVDVGSSLYIPRWHLLLGHQAQNGPWTFAKSIMHWGHLRSIVKELPQPPCSTVLWHLQLQVLLGGILCIEL